MAEGGVWRVQPHARYLRDADLEKCEECTCAGILTLTDRDRRQGIVLDLHIGTSLCAELLKGSSTRHPALGPAAGARSHFRLITMVRR
jgi:hypothetical protein